MNKYVLKYKLQKENRYLYCPISSTTLEEAIKEAKEFIEYSKNRGFKEDKGKYEVAEAYIEKHIESKEIVWGMEKK